MEKQFKKIFSDARRTLKSLEKFKNIDEKTEYLSKVEYVREWRHKNREVLLKRLCPERRCAICQEIKLKSRQLVILKPVHIVTVSAVIKDKLGSNRVVCRSCFRRHWT